MKTQTKNNWFNNQALKFEESRFGAMALMMTFQSCLGSAGAMFAMKQENYVLLSFCAVVTMASNAAFISLAPPKWCLTVFYSSIIINTLVIIISLVV